MAARCGFGIIRNFLIKIKSSFQRIIFFDRIFFFYKQRVTGFQISVEPYFGSKESVRWFESQLLGAKKYLEYGAGGSTYLAAKNNKPFTSIDSDKFFLNAVKQQIKKDGFLNEGNQVYEYVDIGLTTRWGYPVILGGASNARLEKFRKYSDFLVNGGNLRVMPDLILIDGRFRVACALKAARALKNKKEWTLVVDDYRSRPQYFILEKFFKIKFYVGEMAIFKSVKEFNEINLNGEIKKFEIDPS